MGDVSDVVISDGSQGGRSFWFAGSELRDEEEEDKIVEMGRLMLLLRLQMSNWTFSRTSIVIAGSSVEEEEAWYSSGEMRSLGPSGSSGLTLPQKKT